MNDGMNGGTSGPRQSPDLLGPKATLEIQQQGRTAALAGQPVTSCPWRSADTGRDRAARDMWIRGYAAGRTELRAHHDDL